MAILTTVQQDALRDANAEQRKQIAIEATQRLSTTDKQEVAEQGGIVSPTRAVSDRIWMTIVAAFVIVLVGAALALTVGRFIPASGVPSTTSTETIVTLFTTAAAFLAGLLSPSPLTDRSKSGQ